MASHTDILDQPEPLGKSFWVSVAGHAAFAGAILLATWGTRGTVFQMGSPTGGGMGAVMVNPVSTIRLPTSGPQNPVANDTKSAVPTPPKAPPKAAPKAKAPEPDAIPLKSRNATAKAAREAPAAAQPNKWREQQKDLPNQVYSSVGQRANTPMFQMSGGGGVGVGDNSPFGTQFGWYATALRDQIARNWKSSDIHLRSSAAVTVTFTVKRDGSVSNVRVTTSSGNPALDFSAQRAVEDAAPLPPLPPQFPKSQTDVPVLFQLDAK